MASLENSLLVEKYRPSELENYVGNKSIKKSIAQYLDQNDIQNLIFYFFFGTGKTTLAKLIVKNLDCDHLYINASDESLDCMFRTLASCTCFCRESSIWSR